MQVELLSAKAREEAVAAEEEEAEVILLTGKVSLWQWFSTSYHRPWDPRTEPFWFGESGEPITCLRESFSLPNMPLQLHYFNCGFAIYFLTTPIQFYLVEFLGASTADVNTYSALTTLPWCLKIFFGLLTDLVPVLGSHRRPYYLLGWIIYVLANWWLAYLREPGIQSVLVWSFLMTMGYLLSDTAADAMVLECSKVMASHDEQAGVCVPRN